MSTRALSRRIEIACWVIGISLIAVYAGLRIDGEIERRQAIKAFMAISSPVKATSRAAPISGKGGYTRRLVYREPDTARWSRGRISSYEREVSSANRPESFPVAILRIPRVDLAVPVYARLDERNLNRGAALVEGTAAPDSDGNTAIAAHRDGYFRALKSVALGDIVTVQTLSRLRKYRVTTIEIVKPENVTPLHATTFPALTLVTCYPFYFVGNAPRRYIVRAVAMK